MPFEQKKQNRPPGPPTHQQENALWSIDNAWSGLVSVLTSVSKNHTDMRKIIADMQPFIGAAKGWVLEN